MKNIHSGFTEKNAEDACAWNMLGLLSERMDLKRTAANAFRRALYLSTEENKDKAKVNYGRILFKLGDLEKSIEIFNSVKAATFTSGSGLALSLFKGKSFTMKYLLSAFNLSYFTCIIIIMSYYENFKMLCTNKSCF